MEEVVGALTSRQHAINRSSMDYKSEKPSTRPPSPEHTRRTSSSAARFVSSISSTLSRHANRIMGDADEDEDDEDAAESLVRNMRSKHLDTTVRLPKSSNIDVNYYKTTRKNLRSIRYPNSVKRSWWYFLVTVIAFYNVVVIPLRLGFRRIWVEKDSLDVLYVFDYLCDAICILDVVLNFFTAFMERGDGIWAPRKTAMNYLKTLFVFDFIATVPIDIFVWSSIWMHCLFRIPRMLRLVKVPGYFSYLERQSSRPYLFTLLKVVAGALAINHIFACGYWAVSYHEGFGSTRFLPPPEIVDASLGEQYLYAFWWAGNVITRVGGSPVGPVTPMEKGLMLPVAFFTLFFVAFVIGGVSEALNRLGDNVSRFRRKVESIDAFMQAKHIPQKLRRRVKQYFDHLWARGGGQDDSSILRELPAHLRTELSVFINGEIVPKVPFFTHCSAGFIKSIVSYLKPHIFAPGDWIVKEGDAGTDMFFISRGDVAIISPNGETLSILGEGDFFGEICLLIDTQRTASARCLNYCDVFALDKKDLSSVLEHFPAERPLLQELAETRIGLDFLRNIIYRDPHFVDCPHNFLNHLSDTFKFKRYVQGQFFYSYGNILDSDSVFFVSSGKMEILNPQGIHMGFISEGHFYGLEDMLTDIHSAIASVTGVPLNPSTLDTPSPSEHSTPMHTLAHSPRDLKRKVSLRAQTPVCIAFVLRKNALAQLLSQPEFMDQLLVLEKAAERIAEQGQDSDFITRQNPGQTDSLPHMSLRRTKHGNLRKQMSAFLKTPLETAKELARAKERSHTLTPQADDLSPRESHTPVASSSSAGSTPPTKHPEPVESEIEVSLVRSVFGTSDRAISSLDTKEALKLLKVLNSLQHNVMQRLQSE